MRTTVFAIVAGLATCAVGMESVEVGEGRIEGGVAIEGGERGAMLLRADLDNDGALTINDILIFLNWFTALDPRADWNGNGLIDIFDLLAYLADFQAGC